jgi:hypothetical protein
MEIVISEPNSNNTKERWFAGHSRYDTMTDVKFFDDTTFVLSNRMAAVLHLVEFNLSTGSFTILDRLLLRYEGPRVLTPRGFTKLSYTKLVDHINIRGNRIYYVSLDNTIGIVDIINRKFVKRGLLTVNDNVYFHGIDFHSSNPNLAYLSGALHNPKIVLLDMKTMAFQSIVLPGLEGRLIKATRFLDEKHLVAIAGGGRISSSEHEKTRSYDGYIGVYSLPDFKCLDLVTLNVAQSDDVAVHNGFIYAIMQGEHAAIVLKYKFEESKLKKLDDFVVGGFPHGIDIRNGILAVTSMSKSSVQLFELPRLFQGS